MPTPTLRFLDHVAITVANLERSAQWYEEVLGLQRHTLKAWGPYPIFMLAGKMGVAIFPMNDMDSNAPIPPQCRIHHFAFNVDRENFDKAKAHYDALGLEYNIQDHHYFHSIYTLDPDGHKVELTTLVVEEEELLKANTSSLP